MNNALIKRITGKNMQAIHLIVGIIHETIWYIQTGCFVVKNVKILMFGPLNSKTMKIL